MKKVIYYISLALLFFASCEPMEEIYDEIEEMDTGYSNSFEYTLVSDDYATIAGLAAAAAKNHEDSLDAAFIESKEYFNDTIKASEYVPMLVSQMYPGLKKGSTALITYNYNGDMPADLEVYTGAEEYPVPESEYSSIDSVLEYVGYFSPEYAPEVYIPGILEDNITDPQEGDIRLVSYMYSDVTPKLDFESASEQVLFSEGFTEEANGLGQFTATSISGDQAWKWDTYGDGNAKMSGYDGAPIPNEDWLISPEIDLSDFSEASLSLNQAINYLNGQWDQINMYISTDFDGSNIQSATWESFTAPDMPTGDSWSFVESGPIDLTAYAGQTIHIAFKYISSDSNAATWEIAEVKISVPGSVGIIGTAPEEYKDYYQYTDGEWQKMNEVYFVDAEDYDAMGSPGKYNNFSGSDKPASYLPNLLEAKYPLAGEGKEVVVVYKYYMGTTLTLADRYTYQNGSWESSYNYVDERTSQFLFGDQGWVFDPTVSFSVSSEDYQLIVDWVKENYPDGGYIDDFGTGESYTGANSYYGNFDIRTSNYDTNVFESWEDAVAFAIGEVLLPAKFPNAQIQVGGVDVNYIASFATYSGADGSYSMKFKVTKSGPDPEFELVEGPY